MAVTKPALMMLMIVSFVSGGLAVLLAMYIGSSSMLITSAPGFVVGAFFALKYAMYDKYKAKEEEHKRGRNRHKH
ncbi:MAG TPA: hypothetical protein VLA68_06390 [Nitrososphaera sp.]|nr:hypothetical protein [Nitrososphaera sp.]HXV46941.1 hypothetical protein [Nitrososphaera sp.]